MRRILLLAVVMFGFCVISKAQDIEPLSTRSSYGNNHYEFKVTHEMLDRSPAWADGEEYPPLSPGRAYQIALASFSKLIPNGEKPSKGKISLYPIEGKWVYTVEFMEPQPAGIYDGPMKSLSIVVLMSGEAVEPKVTKRKLP
jgi:hypothetical protein